MKNNRYSAYKIANFPDKIASFADGVVTAPIYVRIKPHLACSHGCKWCCYSTGFRSHDAPGHWDSGMHGDMTSEAASLPREKGLEVLSDLFEMGTKAVTFTGGGEPLQHRNIVLFAERTLDFGLDLSLITNGALLNKERANVFAHAKWVRVSMDYQNGEQIAASRNITPENFDLVMTNMAEFARTKAPGCELGVNYIITHDSYFGFAKFAHRLREIGVDNVRVSPVWRKDMTDYHTPIYTRVVDEINAARELQNANFSVYSSYNVYGPEHGVQRPLSRCYFMQMVPVIGADENVYACHHKAFDNSGLIGSIHAQRFRDLWFSDSAREIFHNFNPQHSCRHQCANDDKNTFIEALVASGSDNFV